MSNRDVQSILPNQIKLIEACVCKKGELVELALCVQVERSAPNSSIAFSPRGTWLSDAVSLADSKFKIGPWLESESTKILVSSGIPESEWVLEGKYYFVDTSPSPKTKPKPRSKPKSIKQTKTAPTKSSKPDRELKSPTKKVTATKATRVSKKEESE